jgi:hypothetical protein
MKNPISKIMAFAAMLAFQCTNNELLVQPAFRDSDLQATTSTSDCIECTYIVPSSNITQIVDGKLLGLQPGSIIGLHSSSSYSSIIFRNIVGTASKPIVIKNVGGTVLIDAGNLPFNIKTENSKFFKITGGTSGYGIRLKGGHMGITLEKLSSNFEVNHVEVFGTGFAGIIAKTDPTCNDATIRGNFVMKQVSLHDNFIHDTGGEAFYIGNSFYEKGMTLSCGVRYPHLIDGLRVFNNKINNSGWESIQVGCATTGAYVYQNTITNYGKMNEQYQNNGIQFSEGTKGICYGNLINGGTGTAINVVGYGDSFIHDNIIVNAGNFGIFCDERTEVNLPGFKIVNNTIVNSARDAIRNYGDHVPNLIINNIIVNPGSYSTYVYPRTGNDAYIYLLNKTMKVTISNNILTRDISSVKFSNPAAANYRITSVSPAVDKGSDISTLKINTDYYRQPRLKGISVDIGANEY